MTKMNWDRVREEQKVGPRVRSGSRRSTGGYTTVWETKKYKAKTTKGNPCKNKPQKGYQFCGPHNS